MLNLRGIAGRMDKEPFPATRHSGSKTAQFVWVLKAIGEPTRLQMLALIAASEEVGVSNGELVDVLQLTQPTVSYNLKMLVEAGFVRRNKVGSLKRYFLDEKAMVAMSDALRSLDKLGAASR